MVSNYFPHNSVIRHPTDETFYVSYLPYSEDYGSNTTALVVGQMQRFYILNGDFRKDYAKLIPQGFRACYEFFKQNIDKRNVKNFDPVQPIEELEKVMSDYQDFLVRTRAKQKS